MPLSRAEVEAWVAWSRSSGSSCRAWRCWPAGPTTPPTGRTLFGSNLWLGLGFVFLPWTTLIYGFVAPNGLTLLNIVFLAMAVMLDVGTWGIGFFGSRKEVSNYRGT